MTVAPRLDWKAGSATFTIVLSINAILEPRIAAARIHLPELGGRDTAVGLDWIASSSQGAFIIAMMIGVAWEVRNIAVRLSQLGVVRGL